MQNCGVRRQSEAATALWIEPTKYSTKKRRRRFALPAHSKAYCLVLLPFALEDSGFGAL